MTQHALYFTRTYFGTVNGKQPVFVHVWQLVYHLPFSSVCGTERLRPCMQQVLRGRAESRPRQPTVLCWRMIQAHLIAQEILFVVD